MTSRSPEVAPGEIARDRGGQGAADARLVPATYVVLQRDGAHGTEVLLQLRRGTPYMDGWWACGAAGHVEPGESFWQAGIREAAEEMGVGVTVQDLSHLATLHRTCALPDPVEQRVDVFVSARTWAGEPHVAEPERAQEMRWWPLDALPERVVPHERRALDALRAGRVGSLLTHGFDQTLTLIAAVGRGGVIGDGDSMPWHLPADLRFFKQTTMGGVLVMGRGTWDSIGRALPGRRTIVVTRQRDWTAPGAEVAHSLPEALLMAGDHEVFVAGGGQIYAQTIQHAHRLVLTEVDLAPEGSTRFPEVDPAVWRESSRLPGEGEVAAWVTWERR
ncbi:dihydrofolate reductase [Serinicoccus kebangsaanensis]|uniref:dihydrofolate reductase n=1 Tax=Serinicoccus kebangsaanensis TaxID=2602069 RepID=UPI00124D6101|nr:dihydrofolate reductase [Serinicoccus kebangsaanensis]